MQTTRNDMDEILQKLLKGVNINDPLLPPKKAAEMLGLSYQTLAAWRYRDDHRLPWVRLGRRSIRYRLSEVKKFIDTQTVGA
jgi:predicted DNA-binding transcriptional regulator AlpA